MYVCLCNGISDKKIRQAVRQFSPHSFQQLKKFIPVGLFLPVEGHLRDGPEPCARTENGEFP